MFVEPRYRASVGGVFEGRHLDRVSRHPDRAVFQALDRNQHVAGGNLGVGHDLGDVVDRAARHPGSLQHLQPVGRGLVTQDLLDLQRQGADLLADRTYMAYGLAVAFAMAGLGAYLAGAPFVFIRLLGISEPVFGAFSIANVGSFAIGSAIASRITGRVFTMPGMIVFGGALCTMAGGALVAVMLAGFVSVPTILAPMVFYFVGMGMLVPNAMAAAINRYPDNAGLASALLGALQFGGWSAAGFAVGAFGTASAVPFGAVVAAVGAASLAAFLLLHGLPRRFRAAG